MGIYTDNLPQLTEQHFITDGGLETELVFHHQIDLPEFAAYDLLRDEVGYAKLFDYYSSYAKLAKYYRVGLILETPTWRANSDWGKRIGDSAEKLEQFNLKSVELFEHIRDEFANDEFPIVISGCLGPRGDGYSPSFQMSAEEAEAYHANQINTFAQSNADMVAALTLNYAQEAIGITRAAQSKNLPVCISFTLETNGKLPTGESLQQVIQQVDDVTDNGPVYYMINCAHPSHFEHLFESNEAWLSRLKGVRGNASCLSHEELDNSPTLDEGDPKEFGKQLTQLQTRASNLSILGGCCGTDIRHIEQICQNLPARV